jgi:hypothetical protein
MMMAGHTAGPWSYDHDFRGLIHVTANGRHITHLEKHSTKGHAEEQAANARLIARAPALLEAVEYLLPRVHRHLADHAMLREITDMVCKIRGGD